MSKIKFVLFLFTSFILIACPGSVQVEYKPIGGLTKKGSVFLYASKNYQDTIMVNCIYTKNFSAKKENIIVCIKTKENNNKIPVVRSTNNGQLRLYKHELTERLFILNDTIEYKNLKLRNDTIRIEVEDFDDLIFLYKK